jgi:hypothetical protein
LAQRRLVYNLQNQYQNTLGGQIVRNSANICSNMGGSCQVVSQMSFGGYQRNEKMVFLLNKPHWVFICGGLPSKPFKEREYSTKPL